MKMIELRTKIIESKNLKLWNAFQLAVINKYRVTSYHLLNRTISKKFCDKWLNKIKGA